MRIYLSILLLLGAFGCTAQERIESSDSFDRSSPASTFTVFQQGVESNHFLQVAQSFSDQQKRFMLFETIFSEGMLGEGDPKKEKIDRLFLENDINMDALNKSASDAEDLLSQIVVKIDDLDHFLADAWTILESDSKPRIRPEILDVSIEGDRAIVTHNIVLYSYHRKRGETEGTEKTTVHETKAFLRKYGNEWLFCPEGEWNDKGFKWTVPK